MSGSGAPEQSAPHARGMRVTVVAAQWHERIMGGLVAGALRAVEELAGEHLHQRLARLVAGAQAGDLGFEFGRGLGGG